MIFSYPRTRRATKKRTSPIQRRGDCSPSKIRAATKDNDEDEMFHIRAGLTN